MKMFQNKAGKSFLSLVLALVMILGLMPAMTAGAEGEEGTIAVIVKVTENGEAALASMADGTTVVVKNEGGETVLSFTMGSSDPTEFTGTTGKYTITVTPAEAEGYTVSASVTGDTVDAFEEDPIVGNYAELYVDIEYTPSEDNDQYADEGTLELRPDGYHADTFEPFAADKLVGMTAVFTNQETGEIISSTYNGGTWTIENMPSGSYNLTVTPAEIEGYKGKSECDGACEVSQFKKNDDGEYIPQKMWISVSYTEAEDSQAEESSEDSHAEESADESQAEESSEDSQTEESADESQAEESSEDSQTEDSQAEDSAAENSKPEEQKKTIDEIAREVLEGKWGNGEERRKRLIEAGYDYDAVQAKVAELLAAIEEEKDPNPPTGDGSGVWMVIAFASFAAFTVLKRGSRKA